MPQPDLIELRRNLSAAGSVHELRQVLADALGDPTLELGFYVHGHFVDSLARDPAATGPERPSKVVMGADGPVARLVCSPEVGTDDGPIDAVADAAVGALERARRQLEVEAELEAVRSSRQRIIEAGDRERRKIERDLHDGAQQRLVGLSVALRMVERQADGDPALKPQLELALREAQGALQDLRELARGVHPQILSEAGLEPAIESLIERIPIPVVVKSLPGERLPEPLEACLYFVCSEALQNVAKHARAQQITLAMRLHGDRVELEVADDGVGGAELGRSSGLVGLRDRIEALGGTMEVDSPPGAGTRLRATVPVAREGAGRRFVGRSEELRRLRAEFERARGSEPRLVLIAGEPGIGKTTLTAQFGQTLAREGATVLHGRCDQEALVPYQPFVEALGGYVLECSDDELRGQLGPTGGELARLFPALRDRLPDLPQPLRGEPEGERYRLFEGIATFVGNIASAGPLVIAFDDLHWADKPTLLLLRHVIRARLAAAPLIVGTYRESEVSQTHPLADALSDLRRDQCVEQIPLAGLSEPEAGELIGDWGGHDAPHAFIHTLHAETEGNPFFLLEVLRHLAESGTIYREEGRWTSKLTVEEMGIPQGVRDVIARRLARLSDGAQSSLRFAAMLGREFDLDALAAVTELGADAVIEILEEAVEARVVQERPRTPGRYRFAHALIRETLYQGLSAMRRARLHAKIGERLEQLYRDEPDAHLAELAYQFVSAGATGDRRRAVDYSRRAGAHAAAQLAYDQAAVHYQRALDVGPADEREHSELLLELGAAQWRGGEPEQAQETFKEAAGVSHTLGDAELLARAALGYGMGLGGAGFAVGVDETLVALLEEALGALGDEDSALRVRLLSRLAVELYFTPEVARREQLSREALEMATRLRDVPGRLVALYSRHWSLLGPDLAIEERLAIAEEMIALATASNDREMTYRGHHIRLRTLLDLGDMRRVDEEIAACERLAAQLREPFYAWQTSMLRQMRALHDGNFELAERLTVTTGGNEQPGLAQNVVQTAEQAQALLHRLYGGPLQLAEAAAGGELFAQAQPWMVVWRAALVYFERELELEAEARSRLEALARKRFSAVPRDGNWLVAMHCLAHACAWLGDRSHASILYELLEPYADRLAVVGTGSITWGSIAAALGELAAALERWDTAAGHFEAALERCIDPPLWSVTTRREYARMLLARDAAGDRERAGALAEDATELAERIGMPHQLEQLAKLRERVGAAAAR